MLKNISPLISPSLLKILAEMGHGDEIVFSDAHFPGHTFNPTVLRADGLGADALLAAVIPLFELDAYATPVIMMAPVPGDSLDPAVEAKYRKALNYDGEIEQMEPATLFMNGQKGLCRCYYRGNGQIRQHHPEKRRYPSFLTIGRQTDLPCSTILTK